jgi:NADPH:quinone reductase-like Zn-dependent oxidoreductase
MRAWQWDSYGNVSGLVLHERQIPEPGPGEVLVRVHASALNFRDLVVMANSYPAVRTPPGIVPLCDGAGEVVASGPGALRFQPGNRVSSIATRHWHYGDRYPRRLDLPLSVDGMLADYAVLPEAAMVEIPEHLAFTEAAAVPCAGLTAWSSLFKHSNWMPGMSVVVQGSGGVSLFALQFAKAAGARVIATSSSDDKLARMKALGADATINYRERPDWDQAVLDATGGRGADIVVEVGGSGTLERSLACVRPDGLVSIVGMVSSEIGAPAEKVDPTLIRQKRIRVIPVWTGSRENAEDMYEAMRVNRIVPIVDRVFAFRDAPEAFRCLQAGRHLGKIVITHDV